MQTALVCAVVAVLGGATSPRGPAVTPADQTNPGPAAPDEKPAKQDRRGDEKPVCTLIVVPADPRVDAAFVITIEDPIVVPGMVVASPCRQ